MEEVQPLNKKYFECVYDTHHWTGLRVSAAVTGLIYFACAGFVIHRHVDTLKGFNKPLIFTFMVEKPLMLLIESHWTAILAWYSFTMLNSHLFYMIFFRFRTLQIYMNADYRTEEQIKARLKTHYLQANLAYIFNLVSLSFSMARFGLSQFDFANEFLSSLAFARINFWLNLICFIIYLPIDYTLMKTGF